MMEEVRRPSGSRRLECDDEAGAPRRSSRSASIVTIDGMRRFFAQRFSIDYGAQNHQRSIANWMSGDKTPNVNHYRMSVADVFENKRPTMDDLIYNDQPDNLDATMEYGNEGPNMKGIAIKYGMLEGVYMNCLLNIWGVMLFLRLTWMVGQAGLIHTILIILVANCVTIITALSMSAISTNGCIKAGGIYFMISRSLGPELGGAIGLMFVLANSIAIAMHVIGFCESLLDLLKQYADITGIVAERLNDIRIIGTITLVCILILAMVGMKWMIKVQILLLLILIVSQIDFVVGTFLTPTEEQLAKGFVGHNITLLEENLWPAYTYNPETQKQHTFFSVFAIFFPAFTGIVAGANISGDLRDPSTAIPVGTLSAIFTTLICYLIYVTLMASCSLRLASGEVDDLKFGMEGYDNITYAFDDCENRNCSYGLLKSQQMMEVMSSWGPLIYAGCWAAGLSSAICLMAGAPRVFQAVARDRLFPGIFFFSKGVGVNNEPIRGYVTVFTIALICILIGDLNKISGLLSNFFVAAYCLINFSVFHVSLTKSPNWRPSFRFYSPWVALVGSMLCIAVMFLMDYRTALATFMVIIVLYVAIQKYKPDANWGSSMQTHSFLAALKSVHNLTKVEDHVKNYRPKVCVLSGNPSERPCLAEFGNLLTKKFSLLQFVNIIKEDVEFREVEQIKKDGLKWMDDNNIKGFYTVVRHPDFERGATMIMESSGLGKLRPNMLLMGFQENWRKCLDEAKGFYQTIQAAFETKLAVCILRVQGGLHESTVSLSRTNMINKVSLDSGLEEAQSVEKLSYFEEKINKFKGKDLINGTIDIYWLYDDGGLTLLVPYIITMRRKFAKCKLRVFFLSSKIDEHEEEVKNMSALLNKFRIKYSDVNALKDVGKPPSKKTRDDFKKMINVAMEPTSDANQNPEEAMSSMSTMLVTPTEIAANLDRTAFHLRMAEIVQENSKEAIMVFMTLPVPKKRDHTTSPALYLAWLDYVSKDMPPFIWIRGNQESVLAFYS